MTVKVLPALTPVSDVHDVMVSLTDGSFEVVAVEVFDHVNAVPDATAGQAKRHGAEPGSTLGVWFLGPREEVYAWLEENEHVQFTESAAAGGAPDDTPGDGS